MEPVRRGTVPCAALLLWLLIGCATPSPVTRPEAPRPSGAPSASVPSASEPAPSGPFARELPELPKQRVGSPEGTFIAEVEAAAKPAVERGEGVVRLTLPLGTGAPLVCFVYERPLDVASALLATANAVRKNPRVTVKQLQLKDLIAAPTPALFLDVDYETTTPGGPPGAGQLKLMARAHEDLPLLCAHDEPGYSRTFRRITTGLARSLQVPGPQKAPEQHEDIHLLRLDGHLVGFTWSTNQDLPHLPRKPHRLESTTSLLRPGPDGALHAEDTTTTVLADAEGQVLEYRFARAEDGTLALQATLRRELKDDKQRTYRYEGRRGEKPFQGTFTSKRGLIAEPPDLAASRLLAPGTKTPETSLDVYRPADDVTAPVELTLRKDPQHGPRALTLTARGTTARLEVDDHGTSVRWEHPTPEGRLTSEPLYSAGTGLP